MDNQDQAEDWWVKPTLWQTWALIVAANDGSARVRFISERGEEFGELNFTSVESAIDALRRNKFCRYREDKVIQGRPDLWRPPSPPFPHIERPNLLCSIFWTDIPVSETSILQEISAMRKKYEPKFELEGAFVPGVRGRADPNFRAAIEKRFPRFSLEASNAEMRYVTNDDGAEADPRFNWRVTVRHGGNYIHIMALNQSLSRFACCLQTLNDFEAGPGTYRRYETGTLAEIDPVLDDIYAKILKPEDEQRRQQDRIDNAVAEERRRWEEREERLAEERKKRQLVVILFIIFLAVLFIIGFIIS